MHAAGSRGSTGTGQGRLRRHRSSRTLSTGPASSRTGRSKPRRRCNHPRRYQPAKTRPSRSQQYLRSFGGTTPFDTGTLARLNPFQRSYVEAVHRVEARPRSTPASPSDLSPTRWSPGPTRATSVAP